MTLSLIVSTYNWPKALSLCLDSIMHQRVMPSEILIADDGSGLETREVIERFAAVSSVPVHHIWHEDDGFRLAAIRNKAIAASRGDYIVQIDGDIICHRDFIADHIRLADPGHYVSGSRVHIGESLTARILDNGKISLSPFCRGIRYRFNALRIPFAARWFRGYKPDVVRGCNMAFWRNDMIRVNGYDESFIGWGFEDCDLAVRMRNCGITKNALKFLGISYHLHHNCCSRENEGLNGTLYQQSCDSRKLRCEQGLDQYLRKQESLIF